MCWPASVPKPRSSSKATAGTCRRTAAAARRWIRTSSRARRCCWKPPSARSRCKPLGLKAGERIALNLPNIPAQLYWTEAAKRLGIVYTPVFGGFSDKTLSDRIHDAGARIVITADGGYRNAQIVPFKTAYTDPALDDYVPVATVRSAIAAAAFGTPGPGRRAMRSRCWPRWTRRWPAKSPCSAAMRCAVSAARCATWDAPAD